jgi:hypothetical protein
MWERKIEMFKVKSKTDGCAFESFLGKPFDNHRSNAASKRMIEEALKLFSTIKSVLQISLTRICMNK